MVFSEFIDKITLIAKEKQNEEKENVTVDKAIRAYYYLTHFYPNKIGDVLLFCISMSCLNRYVKQEDSLLKKQYRFKTRWFSFFKKLSKVQKIDGLKFFFTKDGNETILYASIYGFHVSCHSVPYELEKRIPFQYKDSFTWDGIKKQHCANTLFEIVEANDIEFSNLGKDNKPLRENAFKYVEAFKNNEMSMNEIIDSFYINKNH